MIIKKLLYITATVIVVIFIFSRFNDNSDSGKQRTYKKDSVVSKIDKSQYSTTDPDSLWVIVNKLNPLPSNFIPKDLTEVKDLSVVNKTESSLNNKVYQSLKKMIKSSKKEGLNIVMISGYRSYKLQNIIYDSNVVKDGQKKADATSARAGFSEHQTALAVDLGRKDGKCKLEICFGDTKEGKWLANNAHNFGFIIRYQSDEQNIVGYSYEPWHLRYVGDDLSNELFDKDLTMEEFFGYPAAPNY